MSSYFLTEIGVSQVDHFAPIGSQYTGELAEFPKTLLSSAGQHYPEPECPKE